MKRHIFIATVPILILGMLLFSCAPKSILKPIHLKGQAQGTYYNMVYYDSLHRNLQPQLDSILKAFDQ